VTQFTVPARAHRSKYVNGPHHEIVYGRANESAARAVAYLGPYLFWGLMSVIFGGILMLA
jgi:hypothetical protein